MRLLFSAGAILILSIVSAASADPTTQPGYDPPTKTFVSPIYSYRQGPAYEIICGQRTESCMVRAAALCGGPYLQIFGLSPGSYAITGLGRATDSPRVQALVNDKMATVNTNNPYIVDIVCK